MGSTAMMRWGAEPMIPDSAEGSVAGLLTRADLVEEDRAGVQRECSVHGVIVRAVS